MYFYSYFIKFPGVNFLDAYFTWLGDLASVFKLIAPNIKAFAKVFLKGGTKNSTAGTFCVNYLGVDALVEHTTVELAHLIRILADYFELFHNTVEQMIKSMSSMP